MASETPYDVVKHYHHAWTNGEVEAAMTYDRLAFVAPQQDRTGR